MTVFLFVLKSFFIACKFWFAGAKVGIYSENIIVLL